MINVAAFCEFSDCVDCVDRDFSLSHGVNKLHKFYEKISSQTQKRIVACKLCLKKSRLIKHTHSFNELKREKNGLLVVLHYHL